MRAIVFGIVFIGSVCYFGYLYVNGGKSSKKNYRNMRIKKIQSNLKSHKAYFGLKDKSHTSLNKRKIYAASPEKLGID